METSLVAKFKSGLKGGQISKEHRDYELCKVFHRSIEQLENTEEKVLTMYWIFIQEERKKEYMDSKRSEQKSNLSKM